MEENNGQRGNNGRPSARRDCSPLWKVSGTSAPLTSGKTLDAGGTASAARVAVLTYSSAGVLDADALMPWPRSLIISLFQPASKTQSLMLTLAIQLQLFLSLRLRAILVELVSSWNPALEPCYLMKISMMMMMR